MRTPSPESGLFADVVSVVADGLRLTVKAKPGISRKKPPRLVDIGNGKRALEVTVAAAAEDGKANQAILDQLAEHLNLKKMRCRSKRGRVEDLKLSKSSAIVRTFKQD